MSTDEQTFLFADLSGFTALTEVHGDQEAVDLATEFSSAVQELLPDHSGEAVKTIGDAVMIRCADAALAIRLGLRIVHEIGGRPGFPMIRVGMHSGPAIERNRDWFGGTVNLAARVAGAAGGGEVLLTGATRAAAGNLDGIGFLKRGRQSLRNVASPVMLYEARAEGLRSAEGLTIDPVCRMAVDPSRSAGRLSHESIAYHFCSLDCAARFAAAPGRYSTGQEESARS